MSSCPYCGLIHNTTCPKIKAIEYYPDGSTKRVEFHSPVPTEFPVFPNIAATGGRQ
jgi:hypothetical protein